MDFIGAPSSIISRRTMTRRKNMAGKTLTIMCVHGLGDQRESGWEKEWAAALDKAFPKPEGLSLDFRFVNYDDIFAGTHLSLAEVALAAGKLLVSGVSALARRERGILSDISARIHWTAGYVVAWVEDEGFQRQSRKRVLDAVREHQPDVILAHSLGSLVTYNAFSHEDAAEPEAKRILSKARYVTFGSQIGNPFVVSNLTNGRVLPLPLRFWHHLYNLHDDVFTAPIRLWDAGNFRQTDTPFDDDGVADHAAPSYLGHRGTIENVWRPMAVEAMSGRSLVPAAAARGRAVGKARAPAKATKAQKAAKTQKALLVGINDYPDPAQRLEGCVNDVFTMSAVLQECGMPPEAIRTCLDGRATTQGILDRLKWLLDDPKPGDELIFYYSGHGARIPEYGKDFEPDHHVESLVPWDFDWSLDKAISDDQIFGLYSQLPYDCRLVMIFDCCHSGGIHRDGGLRPRGITPPDDIRHRELKWDSKTQMWVARDFTRINATFTPQKDLAASYFGRDGATQRLGRASMLRGISSTRYDKLKRDGKAEALGPYLPLIIEACGEEEYSYEYRHGATSHGAFTFSLASILRDARSKGVTFEQLVQRTGVRLADLRYDQKPQILGPSSIRKHEVPWVGRRSR
jgi:hypothetical protein